MRPLRVLLIASLVVNLGVLVRYVVRAKLEPASGVSGLVAQTSGQLDEATAMRARAKAVIADAESESDPTKISSKNWETLRGSDLKGMAARLRAAGFPDAIIRAIIYAQVNERYKDRQLATRQKMGEDVYWSNNRRVKMDGAMMAENRAVNAERNALTKSLLEELGRDDNPLADSFRKRQYGNLAPEKIQQLESLMNDYNELRGEIYSSAQGIILPEDREKLAFLEKEQQQDLAQLLTPSEREEYEIRSSPLSNLLRSRFSSFEPTEAEFRAIFAATRAAGGSDFGPSGPNSAEQARQREAAIANSLRNSLNPDRFAEYQRLSDPQYATATRITTRLNLPPSAANEIVTIQKESLRQANEVRSNAQLNAEQRAAQLAALGQMAVQRLTTTLGGDRGLAAYRDNGGGWLQEFTPRGPSGGPPTSMPALQLPARLPK